MICNLIYNSINHIITKPFYIFLQKLIPVLNVRLEIGFSKSQEEKSVSIICTLFWSLYAAYTLLGKIQSDWDSNSMLFFLVILACVCLSILLFPLREKRDRIWLYFRQHLF